MRRKLLSVLLCLSMVLTLLPTAALAAPGDDQTPSEPVVTTPGENSTSDETTPPPGAEDNQPEGTTEPPVAQPEDTAEDTTEPPVQNNPDEGINAVAAGDVDLTGSKAEQITPTATVSGNGDYTVNVVPDGNLQFYPADSSIGRTVDGWWIGFNVIAPNSINNDTALNAVKYYNVSGEEKSFAKNKDGQKDGNYYMQVWGLATPQYLATALQKNTSIQYKWYFNWDGNAQTGTTVTVGEKQLQGIDQTFVLEFNPNNVKLLAKDSTTELVWPVTAENAEAQIGETYYATLADAVAAAKDGATITLLKNVEINSCIKVRNKITLDLNGYTIGVDKNATIYNDVAPTYAMLCVLGANADLTIVNPKGNGGIIAKANDSYAVDVWAGGKLTINVPNTTKFVGNLHTIYVAEGTANINGGYYDMIQVDDDGFKFVLNCLDANATKGTAKIIVTGGTFVGVDPSDSAADLANPTNYVATGYQSVKSTGTVTSESGQTVKTWTVSKIEDKLVVEQPKTEGTAATGAIVGTYTPTQNPNESTDIEGNIATDVTFNMTSGSDGAADTNIKTSNVTIPADTAASFGGTDQVSYTPPAVTIKTDVADVKLDSEAMNKVVTAGSSTDVGGQGADITITVEDKTPEPPTGGSAPADTTPAKVVEVTVEANGQNVLPSTATDNGTITITVPAPQGVTSQDKLFAYYGILSGGTFTPISQVTASLIEGKVAIVTGHLSAYAVYTTKQTEAEAAIIDADGQVIKAGALTAMVSDATTGQTIRLQKDVELTSTLAIGGDKKITIDGNNHTISAGSSLVNAANKTINMIQLRAINPATNATCQLTLKNVVIDAKEQCRAIYCYNPSKLFIEAGTEIKNGKAFDYVGGVYMSGDSELTMNGGTITENNKNGDSYNADGYLQYCSDLWIGNNAKGTLNGGTVGNAFVNATVLGGNVGGNLSVAGGNITNVFVEAESNHSGDVVTYTDGKINNLYIAMDYDTESDRVTVLIENPSHAEGTAESPAITGLTIPKGETATVVTRGNKTNYTLTNNITIGAGATLVIPEDVTVTVKKPTPPSGGGGGTTELPKITNNGTLTVNGKLMAEGEGAGDPSTTDSNTVTVDGTGTITGSGTIDLNPNSYTTVTVTFITNGGTEIAPVTVTLKKSGSTVTGVKFSTLNVADPTKSGYTFKGWKDSAGSTVNGDTTITANVTLTAQWEQNATPQPTTYTITATIEGNGTILSNGSAGPWTVAEGGDLTVTVTPGSNYYISYVQVNGGSAELVNGTYTFKNVRENQTIRVVFSYMGGYYPSYPSYPGTPVVPVVPNPGAPSTPKPDTSETPDTPDTPDTPSTPETPSTPSTPTETVPFTDVAASDWYSDAVQYVYSKGMMGGTGANSFSPNATTTRGMIVTILYRLEGEPNAAASDFTDVPASQWYAKAVAWAAANEIVGGYGNGKFGPDDTITREQMAAILYRYAAHKGYDVAGRANLSAYTDAAQISSYALDAMQWANSAGLITGVTDTTIVPTGSATRAQVATILMRFCENIAK